ncbi:MAG: VanW family protein [Clostridia bacterium]|nr:VanW family protein [Clostridia bacterium]
MKKGMYGIIVVALLASCAGNNSEGNEEYKKQNFTVSSPSAAPSETQKPTTAPTPSETLLKEFSTSIKDKESDRVSNIKLAARAIDGTVLKSGEIFSFNKIVGERTEQKGYKIAPILVGKEHEEGIGGGVCQVSTTIYNTAKKAGLEIIERHQHDIGVGYIKKGKDSTVNYPTMDLKFKNNTDFKIKIAVKVTENKVKAEFWKIND